jgi:hypothetical protein
LLLEGKTTRELRGDGHENSGPERKS